jgi:hypothetical protein
MTTKPDPDVILCRACAGTGFDLKTSQRLRCATCGGSGIVKSTDALTSFANDPRHWQMRAEEMRTIAEQMRDQGARGMILRIAEDYDKIAAMLERGTLSTNPRGI